MRLTFAKHLGVPVTPSAGRGARACQRQRERAAAERAAA